MIISYLLSSDTQGSQYAVYGLSKKNISVKIRQTNEEINNLQSELQTISRRIIRLKDRVNTTKCPIQLKKFQTELKQLQWQTSFYLEKIENLKY